jgi:hypothetical protein
VEPQLYKPAFLFSLKTFGGAMISIGYLPASIVAGESIWVAAANTTGATNSDISIPDYTSAGGYSLSYQFASLPTALTVAAVASGAAWTLEVTGAQTLAWKAGSVRFVALASKAGRVFQVDAGTIAVEPSPIATSTWTAVVAACDAAILTYAGNPNSSLSVDGMSVSYRSMDDLVRLRTYAQTMASYETGQRQRRIIRARFT